MINRKVNLDYIMTETKINNEEVEFYDRQIRLWGLEAQNRYFSLLNLNLINILEFDSLQY